MFDRVDDLSGVLTADERVSLEELGHWPVRDRIPFQHAERLLSLGLAELSFGRLDITAFGKRVLTAIRTH